MIDKVMFLASGAFGNMITNWEEMGVFEFVLPFLLIFAVVFGILSTLNIFKANRSINAIIALAVGLMALQSNFVNVFFSEIFPRLGVGLAVIVVVIILIGLFAPTDSWVTITLFIIGAVIFIAILVNSFGAVGWSWGALSATNWSDIIPWIVLAVALIIVVGVSSPKQSTAENIITKAVKAFGK